MFCHHDGHSRSSVHRSPARSGAARRRTAPGRAPAAATGCLSSGVARRRARGSSRRGAVRGAEHQRLHAAPRSAGARDPLLVPSRGCQGDRRERLQDRDDEPVQLVLPRDACGAEFRSASGRWRSSPSSPTGPASCCGAARRPRARRKVLLVGDRPAGVDVRRLRRRSPSSSWTHSARSASASTPRARLCFVGAFLAHRAQSTPCFVRGAAVRACAGGRRRSRRSVDAGLRRPRAEAGSQDLDARAVAPWSARRTPPG